ncbi:ATP-binding protein [Beggiatoa leptomitoformis]|uniref:ATP-binding protein n=1 Tax=Beggiatoa leptomitoformis TaxID=288004 RepID=UPI0013763247|nr:ATP-binding protein [Beggiatoa leptomitoformis]
MPLKYTLMGSFLLLIIPILIALSVFDYLNAKHDLEKAYSLLQQQTENNIINAINLVDAGHKVLENFLEKEIEHQFPQFLAAYEAADHNPFNINLSELKKQLGGKMDLYIINHQGEVKYTTYIKDIGLDFKKFPEFFEFLTNIRRNGKIKHGRIAVEARTGVLRKFSYMPTPDHRYILEMGIQSNEFEELMGGLDLLKIADRLKSLNPSLNEVNIYSQHGHLISDPSYKVNEEKIALIRHVYTSKETYQIDERNKGRIIRYLFVDLKNEKGDASSDPSKVIELIYNTRMIDEGLNRITVFHLWLDAIAVLLCFVLTFMISARLSRPIQDLVHSVDMIAQGDLEHPINVKTNNELELLKQSITIMVNSMLTYIKQIKWQNAELLKLDKLKDDFLSNTSHELRTPINGIIGIAESMIDGATGVLPTKVKDNLGMIVFSGRRLGNLVNDILDFSKLKHQHLELQIKPIEIKVLIDIVVAISRPLIGQKKIELINHIQNDPPVLADENRLQQILYNLIGNAIKFTEMGIIEINCRPEGKFLKIIVSDTGIGIPKEKLQNVFNPFEQADGTISRDFGGTGLGLSITKQLVELHGGVIKLESTPKIGTRVSFTLPLSDKPAENAMGGNLTQFIQASVAQNLSELPAELLNTTMDNYQSKSAIDAQTPAILVVDDDPINLQVLENQLNLENYAITRATNGMAALDAINNGTHFTLVLLDIMMPKMSGFEVCRIIRQTYSANELPIIMLTAKNQVADLVEGLQAGANDYLSKPFSKSELLTRIKIHIQLSRVSIAYSNFVPLEFLKLLEKESIIDVRLGDHVQKYMAVLFADIRSFTTLSESMTPKENFDFINTYLQRVSPVIRVHHGFIDKYIGDALMALFPEKADDAIQAAIGIHRELAKFNAEREAQQLIPIKVGIGLHIGSLMLGTIGEEKRMEGTVISDAVNLASRLEGLTKLYGASILISGEILGELEDPSRYYYRFLGKVRVKGKNAPVYIFEILDAEPVVLRNKKIALEKVFSQAMDFYYTKQFRLAIKAFQQVLEEIPEDKASDFYMNRCIYYAEMGTPVEWQGVEALTEK